MSVGSRDYLVELSSRIFVDDSKTGRSTIDETDSEQQARSQGGSASITKYKNSFSTEHLCWMRKAHSPKFYSLSELFSEELHRPIDRGGQIRTRGRAYSTG